MSADLVHWRYQSSVLGFGTWEFYKAPGNWNFQNAGEGLEYHVNVIKQLDGSLDK